MMKDVLLKDLVDESEEIICVNCHVNLREWLREGKVAYSLVNKEFVCSKRCLMEYALDWILDDKIIKE